MKKTIHEICEMDTLEAWRTTLKQLPKRKLPQEKYDILIEIANHPNTVCDDILEALDLTADIYECFENRIKMKIGDLTQNATIAYCAQITNNYIAGQVADI